MADIRIEKKRKPFWPWLLGLLVLFLIGWGIFEVFDKDKVTDPVAAVEKPADEEGLSYEGSQESEPVSDEPQGQPIQSEGINSDVQSYVDYVEEQGDSMGINHEYTAEGLNELAGALEGLKEDANVQVKNFDHKVERIRQSAEKIQQDSMSLQRGNTIKDAFTSASEAIESIQTEAYPQMSEKVSDLKKTANKVSKAEPARDQQEEVKSFFEESAQTLEAFAQEPKMDTTQMSQ